MDTPTNATETTPAAEAQPTSAAPAATAPAQPESVVDAVNAALADGEETPAAPAPAEAPKPDEAQAAAPDAAAQPAAAANKPGSEKPVDEAMPEGLSEKAKERFTSLVTERNQYRDRAAQWQQTIQSTGASPQQFGEMLEYTRLLNTGTPEGMRTALQMAKDAVRDLSTALGEDVQAIDVLGSAPDLAARVESGEIDRKTALELVRARQTQQAFAQERQAQQQTQASEMATQQAVSQLDQLGQQLRATDPDFARKFEALRPVIPVIAANLPPEKWAGEFLSAYQMLQLPPASVAQRIPVSAQPLRATGAGSTSVRQEPKSALEAVTAALGG